MIERTEKVERRTSPASSLKTALDGRLANLIDKRALSPALTTREMDGRLVPIVFATVLDNQRRPASGLVLELRDAENKVVDRISSRSGLGILRFPARKPLPGRKAGEGGRVGPIADGTEVTGTLFLLDGSTELQSQAVSISPMMQAASLEFMVPFGKLPVQLPPGDDPLAHLPTDFSEDACNLLLGTRTHGLLDPNNLTSRTDPLLSPPPGTSTIVGKRLPLLRRLDVVRHGPDGSRYLVRLRQEWVLLTYTLGELAQVQALDPGAVLQSAEQLASQVTTTARQAVDTAKSTLSSTLQDSLSNLGSVDSIVRTVENTSANAGGSGWYIGIPGIFGYGSAGADATVHLDLSVDTNVNTSLLVNRAVQQVSTLVNEAISKVQTLAQGTQRTVTDVVNHLAPLVSQVANALHWRVYEVYAVCTNVDAVYLIDEVELFGALAAFTPDEVLAYRPFFEPALLDRTLVSAYNDLLLGAEQPPITQGSAEITYNAPAVFGLPATVTMQLSTGAITAQASVSGQAGSGQRVTLQFAFPSPVPRGALVTATVQVSLFGFPLGTPVRAQVWVDRPVTGPGFIIDNTAAINPWSFAVPIAAGPAGADVLVKHINQNLHYYYGVLAASAITVPSLRQDVPALLGLDPRLWRLPLLGMEGTTALLLDPVASNVDVRTLLDDPGAGTLVQILSPGVYGEVLTGILQIVGALHPLLTQVGTISPFGSFPNLTTAGPASTVAGGLPQL